MKSGFINVIGRPNVGKSTIINGIIGEKIAITTSKPQTTRNIIRGILNLDDAQLVFIDTPGIHKPHRALGERMNALAYGSLSGADATVLVVDGSLPFGTGDQYLVDNLTYEAPLFIVFNKIDLTSFELIGKLKEKYHNIYPHATLIEMSAIRSFGFDDLVKALLAVMPEGPLYFPRDIVSDRGDEFVITEIIREKAMTLLEQELPHSVAVVLDKYEMKENRDDIYATIVCERDSHKGMIIGKGGQMIRKIRHLATTDIVKFLKHPIALELYVRVQPNWRDDPKYFNALGLEDVE